MLETIKGGRSARMPDQVGIRLPDGVRDAYEDLGELVGSNGTVLMRQALEAQVPALRELVRRLKVNPADKVSDRLRVQALIFELIERQGERLVRELALTPEEELQQMQRHDEEEEAFRNFVEEEERGHEGYE